jgi:hypothetical protein
MVYDMKPDGALANGRKFFDISNDTGETVPLAQAARQLRRPDSVATRTRQSTSSDPRSPRRVPSEEGDVAREFLCEVVEKARQKNLTSLVLCETRMVWGTGRARLPCSL